MPEGPEVKLITKELQTYVGSICSQVVIHGGRYSRHDKPKGWYDFLKLLPLTLQDVQCHGKVIWWKWTHKKTQTVAYSWIHLGMTGYFSSELFKGTIPHVRNEVGNMKNTKNCHIEFTFVDKPSLYFCDARNFGTWTWVFDKKWIDEKLEELGPDPLQTQIGKTYFNEHEKKWNRKVLADLLLDQKAFAGIGNYLRSDILWTAKINPTRTYGSLTPIEIDNLQHAIQTVPNDKWKQEDKKNSLSFLVYQQKKDPLGNPVQRIEWKGRSLWYAPAHQN